MAKRLTHKYRYFIIAIVLLTNLFVNNTYSAHNFTTTTKHNNPLQTVARDSNNAIKLKHFIVEQPKISEYQVDDLVNIDFSNVIFNHSINENYYNSLLKTSSYFIPIRGSPFQIGVLDTEEAKFANYALSLPIIKAEKDVAEAILKYYANSPHLIWSTHNSINEKGQRLQKFLKNSFQDGLDPAEYKVQLPIMTGNQDKDNLAWVVFDIKLSARLLRYSLDARAGRIIADRISPFYDLPRHQIDLDHVMKQVSESNYPEKILARLQPRSRWYKNLKKQLAYLNSRDDQTVIKNIDTILVHSKPTNDHLVERVECSLPITSYLNFLFLKKLFKDKVQNIFYDQKICTRINNLQKLIDKSSNSIFINNNIIHSLIMSVFDHNENDLKSQKIIMSMERLRWLPDDFTKRYVFVNQPSFMAQYFEEGSEVFSIKVVIGSLRNQTYFFYDNIRLVSFNPSWGVPRSIIMNELVPNILADSNYLSRNGYEVFNISGKKISSSSVDWQRIARKGSGVYIRQKPGPNNQLGELKILFPNKHDIYLHDTLLKADFESDMRALSHGCIRLSDPRLMASAVLGTKQDRLKPYFGKYERMVKLDIPVPVYLVYFTAWSDAKNDTIHYYKDVYSRDRLQKNASQKIQKLRLDNM